MFVCVFCVICDNPNIDFFPPSVIGQDWIYNLTQDSKINRSIWFNIQYIQYSQKAFIFNTQSEMEEFINTHRLSDLDLIEDIKLWKETHNMRYEYKYYSMSELDIDIEPLV